MNSFKEKVHQHYLQLVRQRIMDVQQKLDDLKESLTGETKSTAGDKHETARAFVHIEQENTGRQLEVLLQQKADLERYTDNITADRIAPGALVKTDRGYFYLSAGIGKAVIEGLIVFALSPQSPLGIRLAGCRVNDIAEINNIKYAVENIC